MTRPAPMPRDAFFVRYAMTTRLNDMDAYGHVNNSVFIEYFDSAVNRALIERGALNMATGDVIGLVVHSSYDYFHPLTFPEAVEVGVRVAAIGNSSVTYEFALFSDDKAFAAAQGSFVHVYVDRSTRSSTKLSPKLREALQRFGPPGPDA